MCTMTILPSPHRRVRVAFNRDESRDRPAAWPPVRRSFGSLDAILPIDPVSGGTWLAVNSAGLLMALLNVNPEHRHSASASRSRGEIIPSLLNHASPAEALAAFERSVDLPAFAPFRLVLLGRGIVADVRWDCRQTMVSSRLLGDLPVLFTSSGLGDLSVEGERRRLFDVLFNHAPANAEEVQDTFHQHRWPGREHLSVNMDRRDAKTVSYSRIVIEDTLATFEYSEGRSGLDALWMRQELPLLGGSP